MLPATLVTIVSFLLKICSSSPVYSMQPAYIIANIGTTGRNIRNLPCVSRKSNEKGVCMFAIDCLKANGTHLGTCIDRFYFGSCCHIKPVHDIVENTIDTAIIPSDRQPPSRLSTITSLKPSSSKIDRITSPGTTTTTILTTTSKTTTKASPTTVGTTTTTTTSTIKPFNMTATTAAAVLNKTKITFRTTTPKPTHHHIFGEKLTTRSSTTKDPTTKDPTTKGPTTKGPATKSPTTKSPATKPPAQTETTEVSYKLTTFQTVEENTVRAEAATTKKSTTTTTPRSTTYITKFTSPKIPVGSTKPGLISSSIRPRPTLRPRPPSLTSSKPLKLTKPTYKPVAITTRIPSKPSKTTLKPGKITTTKKSSAITKTTSAATTSRTIVTHGSTTTTERPTKKSTPLQFTRFTTSSKPISTITTRHTTTERIVTTPSTTTSTSSLNVSTTQSNELPLVSSILEAVNGNPATNEIEQVKPLQPPPTTEEPNKPSLVTWAVINEETTQKPTTIGQEWMPITTPDGWVLLPSLSTLLPGLPSITSATLISSTANTTTTITSNSTTSSSTTATPATVKHNETSTQRPLEVYSTSTITIAPFNYTTTGVETTNSTVEYNSSTTTMNVTEALPVVSSTITNLIDVLSTTEQTGVNMSDFTDVCGRRMYPEARIVGGQSATFGKWPWQISLRQWRTSTYLHKCGAALLNENWAITAAHCVDNVPPSDLLLRLGEHDLSTDNEPYIHQERRVQIVASHPQFDPRTFEYDLALLRFYEPVQFKPNIIPVCVPDTDENFVGRTAYVTGWGRLYEDGPLPSVLQEVSVPVINNTVCESMYRSAGYIEHIPHIFICAGWRKGGFDSCEGDSGGPMVIQRPDKRFLLAGIISWGIGCAEPNQPGVYTRISEFRDWINQILQF